MLPSNNGHGYVPGDASGSPDLGDPDTQEGTANEFGGGSPWSSIDDPGDD